MLPSLIETHATLWGAESAGHAVPINFLLQVEHIAALLEASGARILVALGPHPVLDIWQKALQLRERVPGLTLVRVAPPGTPAADGVVDFHAALMAQPDDHLVCGNPGRDDEVAAYFHTGGTTGTPRLVAHTHRGQLVAALGGAVLADMRSTDTLTATLPLFHVGATLVGAVPTSVGAVLDVPLDGADISAVRAGFCGAALLPPAVGERFRQVTGRGLFEVYDMTEASGLIAIDPVAGEGGVGSVGWALPYTRVEVRRLGADGQLGDLCAPGEVGVIAVTGPHVSPGYRNPEHDAGVIEGGRLNSGDLGCTDGAGRIHIAGRSKDLIIRSGHNIDPVMIENAMAEHPAWPRQFHIVEAIPVTSVGKVFKPALRCDAAAHVVSAMLREQHGLPDAQVQVSAGGARGLVVSVTLPAAAAAALPAVSQALAAFLFEARVALA